MATLLSGLGLAHWTVGQATGALGVAVVVAALVHVILQVLALNRRRDELYTKLKHFPGPPLHWLWGILHEFHGPPDMLRLAVDWTAKYGPVRVTRAGPWQWTVTLADPDSIKTVMATSEPKEANVYGFLKPWIGDGLLVSEGNKWFRNRRLLTPAFHFEILKPYVDVYSRSAHVLVKKWKNILEKNPEESVEMFEHVSLMMLDTLLVCAFSYESNCQTESRRSPYIQAIYDLASLVIYRITHLPLRNDTIFSLSFTGHKFRKSCYTAQSFSKKVIKARKKQKAAGNEEKKKYLDFLDILLEARDADGNGLTDTEIQHEVDTFMFEGHDTTASGFSWFLYNMARHPEYQQNCRDEILSVLSDKDKITWDDLHQMEYLTMCIKESLRMHPPVPAVARRSTGSIKLPSGYVIPAGVGVGLTIYGLHHNPDVWPDPETFDPLRFTHEQSRERSSHAFVPFSAGPRNCIGQHFAMSELKTCAAVVLSNFELSLDESMPVVLWPELVLRSKNGIWLKLKPVQ